MPVGRESGRVSCGREARRIGNAFDCVVACPGRVGAEFNCSASDLVDPRVLDVNAVVRAHNVGAGKGSNRVLVVAKRVECDRVDRVERFFSILDDIWSNAC